MVDLNEIGKRSKAAAKILARMETVKKNEILTACAEDLLANKAYILEENKKDILNAENNGMKPALVDRLSLNEERITQIGDAMVAISKLDDPIGEMVSMKTLENGLTVGQKRVPMGVIGIIYESRPNVTADSFALCIKGGSCVILRGGSDAIHSNGAIVSVFRNSLKKMGHPSDFIQLIMDTSRESAVALMGLNKYLDLLIPRGGGNLIKTVVENSTVPVIETGVGNCHIFVDEIGDQGNAVDIIINAKTQRPGTCNSCEKVLIHEGIAAEFLPKLMKALQEKKVEARGDEKAKKLAAAIILADEGEWYEEYLDYIIGIKIVDSLDDAIDHINHYSSHHSEAILTDSYVNSQRFLNEIDSAAVYVNASTRFTDGYAFGLGAEIGISTQKLHARGPMGLKEITTTKYIIYGDGQTRP